MREALGLLSARAFALAPAMAPAMALAMALTAGLACAGGADPAPAAPEEVFALTCAHCHASGLAGVPRAGVPEDWNARDTRDFEVLVARAISGHRHMPPLGSCSWCSEAQLRGAIGLMVAGSEIVAPGEGGIEDSGAGEDMAE